MHLFTVAQAMERHTTEKKKRKKKKSKIPRIETGEGGEDAAKRNSGRTNEECTKQREEGELHQTSPTLK